MRRVAYCYIKKNPVAMATSSDMRRSGSDLLCGTTRTYLLQFYLPFVVTEHGFMATNVELLTETTTSIEHQEFQ